MYFDFKNNLISGHFAHNISNFTFQVSDKLSILLDALSIHLINLLNHSVGSTSIIISLYPCFFASWINLTSVMNL